MTEEAKKQAEMVEVPTQTTIAFKLEDDSLTDEKGLLVRIYNDIQQIKKSL